MKCQIVYLVECLTTDFTFELFLVAVSELVVLVVSLLMETFAAELTDIWLVSLVNPHMGIQCGAPVK